MQVQTFVFNEFQENTYVLYDETAACIIVDAGCHNASERNELEKFISLKKLNPVALVNTHAHIDHVFGLPWAKSRYDVPFLLHADELPVLNFGTDTARMYGLNLDPLPQPDNLLVEGEGVLFGNSKLKILFTPGHSPGSVSLLDSKNHILIAGDVLFQNSIGRFDLPGGDYEVLMKNIFTKLLPLPDDTIVYSGHGPATTIGNERRNNPFILEYAENSVT